MPEDEILEGRRQSGRQGPRLAPDEAIVARRRFLLEGVEPGRGVPASILRSWERSAALGLNMAARLGLDLLSQQKLLEAQQRNQVLVRAARVACHLDATMVHDALDEISLDDVDILFIENVGNLVCPADFDIGQHLNVVLLSVTEGDDKPEKYPVIFRNADLVLITKTDLLPYLDDFDMARALGAVGRLRGGGRVKEVSAKTMRGLDGWMDWLVAELAALPLPRPAQVAGMSSTRHAPERAIP